MAEAAGTAVESDCQMGWLTAVMSLAGATISSHSVCPGRSRFRISLRVSGLGYTVVLDVRVCESHQREVRISPYYVESEELPAP